MLLFTTGSGAVKVCSYKFAEGLALLLGLFCCERDDIYISIHYGVMGVVGVMSKTYQSTKEKISCLSLSF